MQDPFRRTGRTSGMMVWVAEWLTNHPKEQAVFVFGSTYEAQVHWIRYNKLFKDDVIKRTHFFTMADLAKKGRGMRAKVWMDHFLRQECSEEDWNNMMAVITPMQHGMPS